MLSNNTKKKGVELNLLNWGTGIPCTNKRAHAMVVSKLLIISCAKITSFQFRESKRQLQIFYIRRIAIMSQI